MPRTRKIIAMSTGKIGKAKRAARAEGEKKLKVDADELTPPDWLSDEAAIEFERVVREASKIGLLDNLDLAFLAKYADNYARYIKAATQLNLHGATVKMKSGYEAPSPWMTVLNQSAKQMDTCSTKLGLAATDRLKLIQPAKDEKPENKFLKFVRND